MAAATSSRGQLTVLFASQTGTAQDAAECLAREAAKRRFHPVVVRSFADADGSGDGSGVYAADSAAVSAAAAASFLSQLPSLGLVIFVVSTTGDGEMPDGARAFWRFLLRRDLAPASLAGVTVAVFGFGDSGYAKFNAAARKLWARLLQLGATPLGGSGGSCGRGLGDDRSERGALGDLDAWLKASLWPALDELRPLPPGVQVEERPQLLRCRLDVSLLLRRHSGRGASLDLASAALPPHSCLAVVTENTRLTGCAWPQDVRHISLEAAEDGAPLPRYCAGDIVVLRPPNPEDSVRRLAARLGLGLDDEVRIRALAGPDGGGYGVAGAEDSAVGARDSEELEAVEGGGDGGSYSERPADAARALLEPLGVAPTLPPVARVRDLLAWHVDACGVPRRGLLEQLAFFARDPEQAEKLAELATAAGSDLFHTYCVQERRTLVEVLEDFDSISLPLARLLDLAPPLLPRSFSIASAPSERAGRLELCVAVVDFVTRFGRRKRGVCSAWLAGLAVGARVPLVGVRTGLLSAAAAAAAVDARPLLLVGPGTGVAPMRSIWRELALFGARSSVGVSTRPAAHLFFGCRRRSEDWLYGRECTEAAARAGGGLALYEAAFSRDAVVPGASETGADAPGGPPEKDYVQARLRRHGALVADVLLRRGGALLIAGNALRMPADVLGAVRAALRLHGGPALAEPGAAERVVAQLERERRLAVEAWS